MAFLRVGVEPPESPELGIDTTQLTPESAADLVIGRLGDLGRL